MRLHHARLLLEHGPAFVADEEVMHVIGVFFLLAFYRSVSPQSAWTCAGVRGLTPLPSVTRVPWMVRRSPLSIRPLTSPSLIEAGRKARSKR